MRKKNGIPITCWIIVLCMLCGLSFLHIGESYTRTHEWISMLRAEVAYMPEAFSIMAVVNMIGITYIRSWRQKHHLHPGQ